mmetsp:Transcript_53926/g.157353  ORF Transcript_53926/g.157353 Transcript_53926/m.157353 type:complete len:236 (+) Transcript_53926:678-1385(+)
MCWIRFTRRALCVVASVCLGEVATSRCPLPLVRAECAHLRIVRSASSSSRRRLARKICRGFWAMSGPSARSGMSMSLAPSCSRAVPAPGASSARTARTPSASRKRSPLFRSWASGQGGRLDRKHWQRRLRTRQRALGMQTSRGSLSSLASFECRSPRAGRCWPRWEMTRCRQRWVPCLRAWRRRPRTGATPRSARQTRRMQWRTTRARWTWPQCRAQPWSQSSGPRSLPTAPWRS